MNPNDLIRNQQLNKLRGAAMNDDVPAGLSKKPDLSRLHFTDTNDDSLDLEDEVENGLEEPENDEE